MSVMSANPESSRLPVLDGWRAIFIGLVLGSHFKALDAGTGFASIARLLHDGTLGVRGFFVLSGFLITYLLLAEASASGGIDVRRFYARRALRIFPVYVVFLAAIAASQAAGAVEISWKSWVSTLLFYANFQIGVSDWTLLHLWSLAIEQQFYLAWPWVFVALKPWRAARPALVAAAILVMFVLGFRLVAGWITFWSSIDQLQARAGEGIFWQCSLFLKTQLPWLFQGGSTFLYLDTIAIGCAGAILTFHRRAAIEGLSRRTVSLLVLAGVAMVIAPSLLAPEARWLRASIYLLGYPVQALGFVTLIVLSGLFPGTLPAKLLGARWLAFVGMISYSIYIWQQPFTNIWFQESDPLARLVPVLALASVSYVLVERPFNRLRHRFGSRTAAPSGERLA